MPGQLVLLVRLQTSKWKGKPWQSVPPFMGGGLSQWRYRPRYPLQAQSDQPCQAPQVPLTIRNATK
ncbi:hypothetical protein DPMN_170115 [Dreissena polymorpha]|uniref:Uncharacterized protein n=1 Tax=Dreissena polymorpha TaxID=45954 RepID=A0A9D4DX99_DREPO|nr:hypothetical protein DPMN_170115 [Dreissena polymorpha]